MSSQPPSITAAKPQLDQLEVIEDLEDATAENQKPIWKLLLENRRVFLYALFANTGALLFGYDILVQGTITALPAFSMYYGSYFGDALILPAMWQGLWQAMNSLGIMVGAAMNGALQDRFGRRVMFFVGGAISAVAGTLEFISSDLGSLEARRGVLLAGKIILGTGMGILMSSCQTYVSEISSTRLRTILLGLFPLLIVVGQIMAVTVVFKQILDFTTRAIKVPFGSQWAFSGLAMISAFVIPESPPWLISNDKIAAAGKSLERLHGSESDVSRFIQAIQSTIEQERAASIDSSAVGYPECFKGSDLRRTRIVALLNSLQQFMGVALLANSTYFFIMAGMSPTKSLTINQIAISLSIVVTLLGWVVLAKVGRRRAILCGFAVAGIFFLTMGIAGLFPSSTAATNYIGVALQLIGLASSLSVSTAYPIVAAEIPSVRLRAKTLGFGFFVNAFMSWIFNFCVPYMFNADQGNLGGKIGFVFFGTCIIGFVLSWIEIPETKNVTYAQLNYLFQTGTKTREFSGAIALENNATVEEAR
ncbi:general substrate transporter [Dactylonectria estremocensis]|uniref:General substrate transporter n=1 Tax=Dactylonectria estremocensis TaxID=1079267 RepID=A0A9P9D8Z9_9HYPO|nr:general substrate transporter [Dactylonectria estremocensis]